MLITANLKNTSLHLHGDDRLPSVFMYVNEYNVCTYVYYSIVIFASWMDYDNRIDSLLHFEVRVVISQLLNSTIITISN